MTRFFENFVGGALVTVITALVVVLGSAHGARAQGTVATLAALEATPSTAYNTVLRLYYQSPSDAPPLSYQSSSTPCSLNMGNGDTGSQVKSSDSKCWLAIFPSSGADPREYGAKCDGATDDYTALNSWAKALTTGGVGVLPNSACAFGSSTVFEAMTFPAVDNLTIKGSGNQSALVYLPGAETAVPELITIGSANPTATCAMSGLVLQDLQVASQTTMSSGDGLYIAHVCNADIKNVFVGYAKGTGVGLNSNLYNAWHFYSGNIINVRGYSGRASNDAELINGDGVHALIALDQTQGDLVNSAVGLEIAGDANVQMDQTDIHFNGTNISIDQSDASTWSGSISGSTLTLNAFGGTALPVLGSQVTGLGMVAGSSITEIDTAWNGTTGVYKLSHLGSTATTGKIGIGSNDDIFFGSQVQSDVTTGGAGIGVSVTDPGDATKVLVLPGWIASAQNQGVYVAAGATWRIIQSGSLIFNNGRDGVQNNSVNAIFTSAGGFIGSNGNGPCCSWTGSISSGVLTMTGYGSSTALPVIGDVVSGTGITVGTTISHITAVWNGTTGTYTLSNPITLAGASGLIETGTVLGGYGFNNVASTNSFVSLVGIGGCGTNSSGDTANANILCSGGNGLTYNGNVTSDLFVNQSTGPLLSAGVLALQNADGSGTGVSINSSGAANSILYLNNTAGTFASPHSTGTGQLLGELLFQGSMNSAGNLILGAAINAITTDAWSATDSGTKFTFFATPTMSTTHEIELSMQAGVALGSLPTKGVGTLNASAYFVGGTTGVSCSAPPTSSFAVTNGIVTHC